MADEAFPQRIDALTYETKLLDVAGCPAFMILPKAAKPGGPWLWYAPFFRKSTPWPILAWMFEKLLSAGLAVGGMEVGESYGNPSGRAAFRAFHEAARRDFGLAPRACLMPQSRGGLMLYNWAAENAERVACVAGIYTVCDIRSYPGLAKAAPAYGMTPPRLAACLGEHNPIDRLAPLAAAGVPILHIHGDSDTVVPLEANSGELVRRYRALRGQADLIVVPGEGHKSSPSFFHRQELVDFILRWAAVPGS